MSKLTGLVKTYVDGNYLAAEGKGELDPGGKSRAPETHGGKTYYTESEVPASVQINVLLKKGMDVIELSAITGALVVFEADTGQRYAVRNAFATDPVKHNATGKSSLSLSGDPAELL